MKVIKKLLFSAAIASLLSIFLSFGFTATCLAKQMTILVQPFENTGNKEFSWIAAGMADTVITDLTRIRNISVVSNQDRKKVLEEMKFIFSGLAADEQMIKLGKLAGADVIFTGSYLVSGNRVRVNARLVRVETGSVESATKIDGTIDGIFDLQDKVVLALMGETEKINIAGIAPINLTPQERKKIGEKPRPSMTAYAWYAKGLELQGTNPKEALANFKKALAIDPDDTDALLKAGFTAGHTLNLFDEALSYLEKAARIFKGRNETVSADYARLMMDVGSVYARKGQPDRELECYRNAQSLFEKLGLQNTDGYARLMMYSGNAYWSKGQLDRALEYFRNSQFIRDKLELQNTASYGVLMMNIGNVYQRKGQHDRALEYYLNGQSIYERLGLQNTAGYARLMMNTGNSYWRKGQVDRTLECFRNAQIIYERVGLQNTDSYALLMTNIGSVYLDRRQLDRGLEYYRNSQVIFDKLAMQNTDNYALLMMNIGTVYAMRGKHDRALECFLNARSIYDKLGLRNTAHYALLMKNMALLYEKKGQHDAAGRHYRKAYDTYVSCGYLGKERDETLNNAKRLGY